MREVTSFVMDEKQVNTLVKRLKFSWCEYCLVTDVQRYTFDLLNN